MKLALDCPQSLPPSVADRKFRAHSFAAQLEPDHWAMLSSWLFSGDSIEQSVRKSLLRPRKALVWTSAPPPFVVELSIVSNFAPARSPEPPKIVNITATSLPDSQDGRD
jgi:hypothetical protein